MYVRVVRFEDVTPDRIERLVGRLDEAEGPPPGVNSTGIQLLHDAEHGTAIAVQLFETADDMRAGGAVMAAMDPADTPGRRVSVDECELVADRHM
jgi:hypothetical protein